MTQGRSGAGFDIDLADGKARETALSHVLMRQGCRWIECKSDRITRSSGNVFIEYRQRGRPSGIALSDVDVWAIEYAPSCWIILPTERLRGLARLAYRDEKRRKSGGDYNRYEGVLVPLEWLLRPIQSVERAKGDGR